jgi:putative DNA primase/helicase
LGITGEEWDRDPWILACQNGVLDLHTGILRDGRPEEFIKTSIPTEFLGLNDSATTWTTTLIDIFHGNRELIDYFRGCWGMG